MLEIILAQVHLVLYGTTAPPEVTGVATVSTLILLESQQPPSIVPPPVSSEAVIEIPVIGSITPTSGSTGVPKSIVYLMIVFQGPVATGGKNRQLNRTTTDLDRTAVASPRGCAIRSVAVALAQGKIKNRLQPVATGLFHNRSSLSDML